MSVMGHTKMNQLTVAGGKRNEEEDEYSCDDSPGSSMLACRDSQT